MKRIMREFIWPVVWLIVGMFIFVAALYFSSVPSNARPTCNPYNIQNSGGGGAFGGYGEFCDEFPVSSGQHFHCEWGGFIGYGGGCSWRWADNSIAPPPEFR